MTKDVGKMNAPKILAIAIVPGIAAFIVIVGRSMVDCGDDGDV